jgi:hypothetical protein
MSTDSFFLALYMSFKDSPRRAAYEALTEEVRAPRRDRAIAAWRAWVQNHRDSIVSTDGHLMDGLLGKTKTVGPQGVVDGSNGAVAFTVVRAESLEAALKLFDDHPHFSIHSGDHIEVMPIKAPPWK